MRTKQGAHDKLANQELSINTPALPVNERSPIARKHIATLRCAFSV
ncbi:MAG: hypothetical protein IOD12_16040 [Silvanigrellales bacterium]|jgi:hypothetical protein|nr:hypothetical protein [Silvanigrellales bacterium]